MAASVEIFEPFGGQATSTSNAGGDRRFVGRRVLGGPQDRLVEPEDRYERLILWIEPGILE